MELPIKLYEYEHYMYYNKLEKEFYFFVYQQINNEDNRWYYGFVGTKEELWDFIGKRVGYVGAGIMEEFGYYSGENATMQNYISFYKNLIENAEPIEELFSSYNINIFIQRNQNLKHSKKEDMEKIVEAIKINKMEFKQEVAYSERLLYEKNINDISDLREALRTIPYINNRECFTGIKLEKKNK